MPGAPASRVRESTSAGSRVSAATLTTAATPDLLLDWPGATWLPIVVDPRLWAGADAPLQRTRPLVVHAPSNAVITGSDRIEPVVRRLDDDGVIEYRRVGGVPAAAIPALYREADVVLDRFRIGNSAIEAIEAMTAGRVVVGHVHRPGS